MLGNFLITLQVGSCAQKCALLKLVNSHLQQCRRKFLIHLQRLAEILLCPYRIRNTLGAQPGVGQWHCRCCIERILCRRHKLIIGFLETPLEAQELAIVIVSAGILRIEVQCLLVMFLGELVVAHPFIKYGNRTMRLGGIRIQFQRLVKLGQ